jgi:hypothetical protein
MMKSVDALAEKLRILLLQGALAASRLSRRDRIRLQALFDAEVLHEERAGAGLRIVVKKPTAFQAFAEKTYPAGLYGGGEELPFRARAVAELRDSKKAKGRCPATVLLRGFRGAVLSVDDNFLEVAAWTAQAGVAVVALDRLSHWNFSGVIAVVENLEVFWNIEKVEPKVELALFAEGRLDKRILAWLASTPMQGARIIHFGDYDPVGLDEYLRYKEASPGRIELYRPPNLEELFRKYGKPRLLTDSAAIMPRLRQTSDPDACSIIQLMDRFGAGLEQEALLIGPLTKEKV